MIRVTVVGLCVLAFGCAAARVQPPQPPSVVARGDGLEATATVDIRLGMTPPAQVGAWRCEPRSWDEHGVARLRCTAPAGTTGFVEALRATPEVTAVHGVR